MQLDKINLPALETISEAEIEAKGMQLANLVHDGNVDALDFDIRLKSLEKILKVARDSINSKVIFEVEQNHITEKYGVKIAKKTGSVQIDYEANGQYLALKHRLKTIEEEMKLDFKLQQSGKAVLDKETGEIFGEIRAKGYGKDSVSYTFKK